MNTFNAYPITTTDDLTRAAGDRRYRRIPFDLAYRFFLADAPAAYGRTPAYRVARTAAGSLGYEQTIRLADNPRLGPTAGARATVDYATLYVLASDPLAEKRTYRQIDPATPIDALGTVPENIPTYTRDASRPYPGFRLSGPAGHKLLTDDAHAERHAARVAARAAAPALQTPATPPADAPTGDTPPAPDAPPAADQTPPAADAPAADPAPLADPFAADPTPAADPTDADLLAGRERFRRVRSGGRYTYEPDADGAYILTERGTGVPIVSFLTSARRALAAIPAPAAG